MKENTTDKEVTVRCECGDPGCFLHLLRFDDFHESPELYFTVQNNETSLWWRLKTAWRILIYGAGSISEVIIYNKEALVKMDSFLQDAIDEYGEDK